MMETTNKLLTRVQLVNWHYFENETIITNGSTLISGENTAGKSTILDAIQLVLTTNSRRFNVAANEKGKRNLKGYVRCKLGVVGQTYLRKGTVPSNVALEFYEEKQNRYFVLGVHLLSVDEESPVIKKWYAEECRLEDLNFITEGHASLADEFRNRTRKINYFDSDKRAKDKFRHRMGNLDEKFFDIIPKSLAFKPMDNVKDFINKFVLNEGRVDVESLRNNIELLDDLEKTLDKARRQLSSLEDILKVFDDIDAKDRDIIINDIMLRMATKDATANEIARLRKNIDINRQTILGLAENVAELDSDIKLRDRRIIDLKVDISNNKAGQQAEGLKRSIEQLKDSLSKEEDNNKKLTDIAGLIASYIRLAAGLGVEVSAKGALGLLMQPVSEEEKRECIASLDEHFANDFSNLLDEVASMRNEMSKLDKVINDLRERQVRLEKRQLIYPPYVTLLKSLIEAEFKKRGLDSRVYILAELLEVTDERWRDAIEGYFNRQKYYLVTEPEYYDIAIEVYDKNRDRIHSAGIINTKKLPMEYEQDNRSLAYVIKSDNRYARAYAWYLLGRVVRCDNVKELEKYNIAITSECMLYQGYVIRHLNPESYKDPYIGNNAYRVQLLNVKEQIEIEAVNRKNLRKKLESFLHATEAGEAAKNKLEIMKLFINSPLRIKEHKERIAQLKAELALARKDPTLIEMNFKLDELEKEQSQKKEHIDILKTEKIRLESSVSHDEKTLDEKKNELSVKTKALDDACDSYGREYELAKGKYAHNLKTKEPQRIYDNFSPQRSQFENEKNRLVNELLGLQNHFNSEFSMDFTTGVNENRQYIEAADKLRRVEIVKYEDKLKGARADCEKIFRSDFLSKMKEHIESARREFNSLNKALSNIYYGDDSYHFKITYDKRKENLYKMITSEYNVSGEFNLWSESFNKEYRDEIDDLFEKLMVGDDNGEKVIEEYTDYRSYLDYDIEIRKRNGDTQRFSEIYGEKSGSETQVPYYVAIAASFYQLYRYGNSVRLMLLDEAFDKMDDERITSMMDFMNSLNLQLILATPPQKIEIIGEKVDTILAAIRVDKGSIVEEYELG